MTFQVYKLKQGRDNANVVDAVFCELVDLLENHDFKRQGEVWYKDGLFYVDGDLLDRSDDLADWIADTGILDPLGDGGIEAKIARVTNKIPISMRGVRYASQSRFVYGIRDELGHVFDKHPEQLSNMSGDNYDKGRLIARELRALQKTYSPDDTDPVLSDTDSVLSDPDPVLSDYDANGYESDPTQAEYFM